MASIGAIPSPPPKWNEEVFLCSAITNRIITLAFEPHSMSQFVFHNGVFMAHGASVDYTILGKEITFNFDVLANDGHVAVKYSYT